MYDVKWEVIECISWRVRCACLWIEVQIQLVIPPLFSSLSFPLHSGSSVMQDIPFSKAAVKAELFRLSNWPEWR